MVLTVALTIIVFDVLCGLVAGEIADRKHRSWIWALVGYVFGLLGVALIFMAPKTGTTIAHLQGPLARPLSARIEEER